MSSMDTHQISSKRASLRIPRNSIVDTLFANNIDFDEVANLTEFQGLFSPRALANDEKRPADALNIRSLRNSWYVNDTGSPKKSTNTTPTSLTFGGFNDEKRRDSLGFFDSLKSTIQNPEKAKTPERRKSLEFLNHLRSSLSVPGNNSPKKRESLAFLDDLRFNLENPTLTPRTNETRRDSLAFLDNLLTTEYASSLLVGVKSPRSQMRENNSLFPSNLQSSKGMFSPLALSNPSSPSNLFKSLLSPMASQINQNLTYPVNTTCPTVGSQKLPFTRDASKPKPAKKHPKGKRCEVEGCEKRAQSKGKCKAHGGGARCQVEGCTKSSQGGGLCRSHGGGKRCTFPGCKKGQQRSGRCYAHGGVRQCQVPNCEKKDRGNGFCTSHGGGKRCAMEGCHRAVRKGQFCQNHSST